MSGDGEQGALFETDTRKPWQRSALEATPPSHLARSGDPDTSRAAAVHAAYRSGTLKALLLTAYRQHPEGLTDEEAAAAAGLDPLRGAWKRCADLRNDGWIERVGDRIGSTGERVMVCRVVSERDVGGPG